MSAHLLLFDELCASLVHGVEALLFAALHGLDALPPLLLRALTQLLRLPLRRQQLLEPLALLRLQSARQATSYSIIGLLNTRLKSIPFEHSLAAFLVVQRSERTPHLQLKSWRVYWPREQIHWLEYK